MPLAPSVEQSAVIDQPSTVRDKRAAASSQRPAVLDTAPLVSCIMPTNNRRAFIPDAIELFRGQDYSNLELLILDDGSDSIVDLVPHDDRIRYFRLDKKQVLGAKRNRACELARGEIIAHWDDDDWYPPVRVSRQVHALLEHNADICGTSQLFYLDRTNARAWRYQYSGGQPWVAGSTLAYRKAFWARHRFPEVQVGEDTRFLWTHTPKIIHDLADPTLCVARLHPHNTSRKNPQGAYWHSIRVSELDAVLSQDAHVVSDDVSNSRSMPLISCIMPTHNRRAFLSFTLECFLGQDYPNKELIIVDDGSDPVGDLVAAKLDVRYIRLDTRLTIGAKRNLACQQARGQIIAHWDDDDWSAPTRLSYQVTPLYSGAADLTGLENRFVLNLNDSSFWTTTAELHQRMFVGDVHGGTLMFRKSLWDAGMHYPEINLAEDARFLQAALRQAKHLTRLPNSGVFVYVRHGTNAWRFETGTFLDPQGWRRTEPPQTFPASALVALRKAAHFHEPVAMARVLR